MRPKVVIYDHWLKMPVAQRRDLSLLGLAVEAERALVAAGLVRDPDAPPPEPAWEPREGTQLAVRLEKTDKGDLRGIMFEIDLDHGAACICDVAETGGWGAEEAMLVLDVLLQRHPGCDAVYIGALGEEGGVRVGNHYVDFPDALTVKEAAMARVGL